MVSQHAERRKTDQGGGSLCRKRHGEVRERGLCQLAGLAGCRTNTVGGGGLNN